MPVESVVRATCDRCGRQWFLSVTEGGKPPSTPSFSLEMLGPDGEPVFDATFSVLCASCTKTVANYAEGICKDLRKPRAKKKRKGAQPPSTPPA